jgi:hypothetical protein
MTSGGDTLSRLDLPGQAGFRQPAASHDGTHHFGTTDHAG